MSNYIKIPLADNPGRSFKLRDFSGEAEWASATGSLVAGTAVTGQAVLGGSGSGAIATIEVSDDANLGDVSGTITTVGQGYKVGDIVTFAAETTGAGASTWSEALAFTLEASDLIDSTGSDTIEYALVPVDNVACVHEDSATSAIIQLKQVIAGGSGTGDGPIMQYAVTMDDVPAITKEQLWADISDAIAKAASAENSQPEVKFTNDAECLAVVLS